MHSIPVTGDMDFETFRAAFPLQGRALYRWLYERNRAHIGVSKAKFAMANLEKIFAATFALTPRLGFPAMSLRDLSRASGLSMGGIYSTIDGKERIALMVKEVVEEVTLGLHRRAAAIEAPQSALDTLVREHLYATEILQQWFAFLYFETRSLAREHQEQSKAIEQRLEAELRERVAQVRAARGQAVGNAPIIATMLIALIQDRYLKPWKHGGQGEPVEQYAQQVLSLLHCAMEHP